jgi:hypothetical protein
LIHLSREGRCDRYVPLELPDGLNSWLSDYLASWRVRPALVDGAAVDSWVELSATVRLKLSGLDSTTFQVDRDREYSPE